MRFDFYHYAALRNNDGIAFLHRYDWNATGVDESD
jgi:hypothetical protein